MFVFDLSNDPPTAVEIKAALETLKSQRRTQIKHSCISDVLHAFIFIGLYFNHSLSGYAILVAVSLSTIFAVILATATRQTLQLSDRLAIALIVLGSTIATIIILLVAMKQPLPGSLVAGITGGSIVLVGATLGRKIKNVMVAIEHMKPITEDDSARQELMVLCREFPEFNQYRELAAQNLRPNLTYGELNAMKKWRVKK